MLASASLPARAYIGIGSNLDNPLQQALRASEALAQLPQSRLLGLSPWYGSSPAGGEAGQPDYVNGVACLDTALSPLALLDALQALEQAQGRVREARWGPRTLDLDLLLYGDLCLNTTRLVLPHPRLQQRAFVLQPLFDLAPELLLPNGTPVRSLLAGADKTGIWRLPGAAHPATTEP